MSDLIRRAATVWNAQPLQQQFAEVEDTDTDDLTEDDSTDEEGSESVDDSENDSGEDDSDEDKPLGPKGEKALEAEKEKRRTVSTKLRAANARIKELEAQIAAGGDEDATERQRLQDEATARANTRIIKAELKAAAAGKLTDPSDALVFVDLEQFDVDEDGDVDTDAIADAIADLLDRKPHLAAQSEEKKKTPKPDRSQGARGTGSKTIADDFAAALGSF